MKVILAPARNNRPAAVKGQVPAEPMFAAKTARLVERLQEYSPWQLESLLDVRPDRALELYASYQNFEAAPVYPALLSYYGAAYRNMRPAEFSRAQLRFAQGHLYILSALYGMLRPMDGIVNHRLGLKKDFKPDGTDLHCFWGDAIYKELYKEGEFVVNLASVEYAKLVLPHMRQGDGMLVCRFLVDKPGGPRATVSTVRAARGLMARFIVENSIEETKYLREFDLEGYRYAGNLSTEGEYVFVKQRAILC